MKEEAEEEGDEGRALNETERHLNKHEQKNGKSVCKGCVGATAD